MPTGYTAPIADGITFKQFIMSCARAFGACIEMRDDPMDAPIPDEFKPSDYNARRVAEGNKELEKLQSMSPEQCNRAAKAEYDESVRYHKAEMAKDADLKRKYEAMLADVEAWQPPTKDHEGLKKFMREQITESIQFDCGSDYHSSTLSKLKPLTGQQWRTKKITEIKDTIVRATKSHQEEVDRASSRTAWVRDLRKSI